MPVDYILLLVVAVIGITLGLYTLQEAKKYRARKNAVNPNFETMEDFIGRLSKEEQEEHRAGSAVISAEIKAALAKSRAKDSKDSDTSAVEIPTDDRR
jgi:hypothetical protein